MAQQTMTGRARLATASAGAAPEAGMRIVGALLALGVAAAHVADQGGVTAFTAPDWIGWGYRLIEVGGVLTALAMPLPWPAGLGRPWLRWAAAMLLGAGPFIAYVASRTVGMPGDPGDVGNFGLIGALGPLHDPAEYRPGPDVGDLPVGEDAVATEPAMSPAAHANDAESDDLWLDRLDEDALVDSPLDLLGYDRKDPITP